MHTAGQSRNHLCTCTQHLSLGQSTTPPQDIKFNVHAHPTLSEVLDELFKGAHLDAPKAGSNSAAAKEAKQPVAA